MTNYEKEWKKRIEEKEFKDLSFFGTFAGFLLIVIGYFRWLFSEEAGDFFAILMILGTALLIFGVIIPEVLTVVYSGFRNIGNIIGKIIFSILLCVVYIILIIPVGLYLKYKKNNIDILSVWDDSRLIDGLGFVPWELNYEKVDSGADGLHKKTLKIIGYFIMNGHLILIPCVILLVLIGLVLFFVSASVVAPFIYTLF